MIDELLLGESKAKTASPTHSYFPGESRSETGDDFLEYLKDRAIHQKAIGATATIASSLLALSQPTVLQIYSHLLSSRPKIVFLGGHGRSESVKGSILNPSTSVSLAGSKPEESETFQKIEALFRAAAYEVFEYGMESEFTKSLESLLLKRGKVVVQSIARIILSGQAEPEIAAEALRWLGTIYHHNTHNMRFRLLAACLRDPSHWVRDGALLGLDAMNDKRAISYLLVAGEQESDPMLRRNIVRAVRQLEQDA
jgi:hypothetical protein